jgi:hypothetical protein
MTGHCKLRGSWKTTFENSGYANRKFPLVPASVAWPPQG